MRARKLPFTANQLLALAKAQLGETEHPANSNISKYNRWFGWLKQPWCAMFVVWLFAHVKPGGVDIRLRHWLNIPGRSAASTRILRKAMLAAGWREVPVGQMRRGDIDFWVFGAPVDVANINHVSIALGPVKNGMVASRDGNSGPSSENNGGEVCDRRRPATYVASVIRPPYAKTTTLARSVAAALVAAGVAVAGFNAAITAPSPAPMPSPTRIVVTPTPTPVPSPKPVVKPTPKPAPRCAFRSIVGPGSHGAQVRTVQKIVKVTRDGAYGPRTTVAVKKWQRAKHLKADGLWGHDSAVAAGCRWSK